MTLCIYHGNCADGFGAAWVVRKALGKDVDFHAGVYGDEPPDVAGKDVLMVDFSYKYDVLAEMSWKTKSLLVLDHHKTAAEDLARLPAVKDSDDWIGDAKMYCQTSNMPYIGALFDMDRSGAGIAWDYFFPDQPRPKLIDHIEDRDLWRFNLPMTREIQAAVFSYPYDFDIWDKLMDGDPAELVSQGQAIERKHFKDINELVGVCQRRMRIGGHDVPAASLPYTLTSDAGHKMAEGEPFACCYWDTPAGRVYSLRSTDEGLDVSEIAKAYGGGGHRNAAGFQLSYDRVKHDAAD